jgi:integrase
MLGPVRLTELKTARIRQWHRVLCEQVGSYTAKVAKKCLRSALSLVAEDFELRVPQMPSNRGRGIPTTKKTLLSPAEIGFLLRVASNDNSRGIYYAFPFLTGVRPSEQLALLWDDVDFVAEIIRIRRMQESDGSITELTKTAASTREVPISPLLKSMLLKWRAVCPVAAGRPLRVFPALGVARWAKDKRRCCPLSYVNFRNNYWRPAFAALGLPYVTPHSARHSFISTLQASGIEIGLVAKLAGHANPSVTLGHYTQAVRCGDTAVAALERAYVTSNGFLGDQPGDGVVAGSEGEAGGFTVDRPAWSSQ